MTYPRVLLFALTLAASMAAHAQYSWLDKDGRRVFSDRPPPADVPAKNLMSQPRGSSAAVVRSAPVAPSTSGAGAAMAPASAASAATGGVDKGLEEKKRQADAAEAAKKQADSAKLAAQRADNCKRAMTAKSTLDSGMRVGRVNDKGEREILDDAQRTSELQRANDAIAANCK